MRRTITANVLAAVGALVEMQGIVRMMGQLCTGIVSEQRGSCGVMKELEGGPWRRKKLTTVLVYDCESID